MSTNNNTALTDTSSVTPINTLQQQKMERLRMMNQGNILSRTNNNILCSLDFLEMHALWPYGTATFISPMLAAHNMPLPYALGALPYAAVPIYQSLPNSTPQHCTISPAFSSSSGSSAATTASNPQQQQMQQYLIRSNSITNSTCANGN